MDTSVPDSPIPRRTHSASFLTTHNNTDPATNDTHNDTDSEAYTTTDQPHDSDTERDTEHDTHIFVVLPPSDDESTPSHPATDDIPIIVSNPSSPISTSSLTNANGSSTSLYEEGQNELMRQAAREVAERLLRKRRRDGGRREGHEAGAGPSRSVDEGVGNDHDVDLSEDEDHPNSTYAHSNPSTPPPPTAWMEWSWIEVSKRDFDAGGDAGQLRPGSVVSFGSGMNLSDLGASAARGGGGGGGADGGGGGRREKVGSTPYLGVDKGDMLDVMSLPSDRAVTPVSIASEFGDVEVSTESNADVPHQPSSPPCDPATIHPLPSHPPPTSSPHHATPPPPPPSLPGTYPSPHQRDAQPPRRMDAGRRAVATPPPLGGDTGRRKARKTAQGYESGCESVCSSASGVSGRGRVKAGRGGGRSKEKGRGEDFNSRNGGRRDAVRKVVWKVWVCVRNGVGGVGGEEDWPWILMRILGAAITAGVGGYLIVKVGRHFTRLPPQPHTPTPLTFFGVPVPGAAASVVTGSSASASIMGVDVAIFGGVADAVGGGFAPLI
ncbi:hypothetical protein HDV00_005636 [Rhizophlyctis rosea]|nr:hypothetical protein HDV00_005636 [Rhizophlyctis rosea]